MLFGRLKKVQSYSSVRIIVILLSSLVVTIIVNSMHPAELPLMLAEGQRPGIPKGAWEARLRYVSLGDVVDEITAGQAILIDLRDAEDFSKSHAPGSINLPYHEFDDFLPDFEEKVSTEQRLFIFGQGMLFGMSARIAKRLSDLGYNNITILKQGFEQWKKLDLPVYNKTQESGSHEAEK